MKWKSLSRVWFFATPWTIQSMEFSKPPFPASGDLPNPGIKPRSPALHADSLPAEPQGKPYIYIFFLIFIFIYIYIWVYIITYINIWFKHFYWNIIVLCNKLHILKVYNLLKFWFMLSNISLYSFVIFSILSSCLICYYYWSTLFHLH